MVYTESSIMFFFFFFLYWLKRRAGYWVYWQEKAFNSGHLLFSFSWLPVMELVIGSLQRWSPIVPPVPVCSCCPPIERVAVLPSPVSLGWPGVMQCGRSGAVAVTDPAKGSLQASTWGGESWYTPGEGRLWGRGPQPHCAGRTLNAAAPASQPTSCGAEQKSSLRCAPAACPQTPEQIKE